MKASLDTHYVAGKHACAMVLKCAVQMVREKEQFRHGITRKEMESTFPRLMGFDLATYGNRMRDNVNLHKTMSRHDVHGERHFYPLCLDEDGEVDHSKCNCNPQHQTT